MKCLAVVLLLSFLYTCARAEATADEKDKNKFGSGHVTLLQNISESLDASIEDKRLQHKKIMEASVLQHGELEKERERIHKEMKIDRAQQFQEIMKIGDKQHEDFKNILEQVMRNIESTDAFKLGQIHMDMVKKISNSIEQSTKEAASHKKELQDLYSKQHAEIKNKKTQEVKDVIQDRNVHIEALNTKRTQQEAEIKKLLQAVMSRLEQPRNCYDLYQLDVKQNGVYLIKPEGMTENHYVYCDMENHGNGWTVIQRRGYFGKPYVDFIKGWADFKNGFGKLTEEFWLGNNLIHHLTKDKPFQLYIEMRTENNMTSHATFRTFQLKAESEYYKLIVGGSGATGQKDAAFLHAGNMHFSTVDQRRGCGSNLGGWWYFNCETIGNLNGARGRSDTYGFTFDGSTPLAYSVMKIKPLPS